jgi:hypothetical protein
MSNKATPAPHSLGLPELERHLQRQNKKHQQDGKKIFELVVQQQASAKALKPLVYEESLWQLILYALDHRTQITSRANQGKSSARRKAKASDDRAKVFGWCNANPALARYPYKSSVDLAGAATNISALTSVRDYISEWRKEHPLK